MSPLKARFCLLLAVLPAAGVAGQPSQSANPAPDVLDEVLVQADRQELQRMRQELARLEDVFYGEYNKLNTDNRFDIVCVDEAMTGTAIRRRACRPRFVVDATADEFHAWFDGHYAPPSRMMIAEKGIEMERRVNKLMRDHPELRGMLSSYTTLKARYEAQLRKQFR